MFVSVNENVLIFAITVLTNEKVRNFRNITVEMYRVKKALSRLFQCKIVSKVPPPLSGFIWAPEVPRNLVRCQNGYAS